MAFNPSYRSRSTCSFSFCSFSCRSFSSFCWRATFQIADCSSMVSLRVARASLTDAGSQCSSGAKLRALLCACLVYGALAHVENGKLVETYSNINHDILGVQHELFCEMKEVDTTVAGIRLRRDLPEPWSALGRKVELREAHLCHHVLRW